MNVLPLSERVRRGTLMRAAALLVFGAALLLPACDSGDDDDGDLSEVSGVYEVQELRFVTDGSAVADADVLGRISNQEWEFFPSDGTFAFAYDLQTDAGDTDDERITGSYDVGSSEVRLDIDSDDSSARQRILLPDEFELEIDGDQLVGTIDDLSLNLGVFSEEQFGNRDYDGTLQIRLQQQ